MSKVINVSINLRGCGQLHLTFQKLTGLERKHGKAPLTGKGLFLDNITY